MYIAQMFAKLVFASKRLYLAITSFNMTLEFWFAVSRLIMAVKVIHPATSGWAAGHQADVAVWTCFIWDNRLVPDRRSRMLTRHVVLLGCRINGCS